MSFGVGLRGVCYIPNITGAFTYTFVGYLPIALIFSLNFRILSVARRHRKRIFAEDTTIASVDNSTEKSTTSISLLLRFFVALKSAKTFAIIVAVLTFCNLIPTVFGPVIYHLCTGRCKQIWYIVFHYELYGVNSVVNAFIYGMRHVKYRKAYLHILFNLFSCHKATE